MTALDLGGNFCDIDDMTGSTNYSMIVIIIPFAEGQGSGRMSLMPYRRAINMKIETKLP